MSLALSFIVLIKQVPDVEKVRFDVETGRIDRSSAEAEINPFDLNALEAAVTLKERLGGKVTVLTMGPLQADSALRDALSRGADQAILLEDNRFAGADTLATSTALAYAIRKVGSFDMVLCGEKTVDGDTGQVGPEVSEHLGVAVIPYVSQILDATAERIIAVSEMDDFSCVVQGIYPLVLTVTKDLNKPRLPTLREKLKAKKATIIVWHADDLRDFGDLNAVGYQGSPTRVSRVVIPPERNRRGRILANSDDNLDFLAEAIMNEAPHPGPGSSDTPC